MGGGKPAPARELAVYNAGHHADEQSVDGDAGTARGTESRSLLRLWGKLHGTRSALGSAASLLFAWGFLVTR
jgi:hypothetical protein